MFPDMFDIFREQEQQEQAAEESAVVASGSVSSEKIFAVSIGGSIIVSEKPNTAVIAKVSHSVSSLFNEGYRFALVVGGGKACRHYVSAARAMGANNFFQDEIGIAFTRINAALVIQSLEKAYPRVVDKIFRAREIIESGRIPVFGGMLPGITTDCVAALVAESLNATFINLSNVDGVFSSDPSQNPHAKFYPSLSYSRLVSLLKAHGSKPAQNLVLDMPAALVLQRSKIPSLFLNGNNLENFEAAVRGHEFKGTIVKEFSEEEKQEEQE